ncbi:GMC family oxidoreductase [Paraburkholderia caribensis]|uniref:GMC family oxidoreductase n=1 Tax=Paraburkholderia caribensis TaxID=75105 RepID=UPI001CB1753C|nr:GMC family oxidoreductase N-terminal domain-containing protein [Paraburkholderia caribensis]CAG9243805.1 putative 5-(hydroxymethyl)furfural oxidase [Paraburkholderia caribensis]
MNQRFERATHLIVGGGAAGCVFANRLSADPRNKVVLVEAGPDTPPDATPADILATYPGRAMANMDYFWQKLRARRGNGDHIPEQGREPMFFHQARVMGGGSSINAQIALRGLPRDFDGWRDAGAQGWDWDSVLPYFRKLEKDVDFSDTLHGTDGPVLVRRVPRGKWDHFTQAVGGVWSQQGHAYIEDMNGDFDDGFSAVPFSNDGMNRWSAARSYLTPEVRRRSNLQILPQTEVTRIRFDGRRAIGVDVDRDGAPFSIDGDTVILTAGGVHTPKLLMLSGIGPADHLAKNGIPVVLDRRGVGSNLQDHPSIYVSCFMPPEVRSGDEYIGPASYLRYTSGIEDCPASDMVMISAGRSGWHAVGRQLATLVPFIGIPFSRGVVRLTSSDWRAEPDVCFNFLDDWRDRKRLVDAFKASAEILMHSAVSRITDNPFPSAFTERAAKVAVPTTRNRLLTDFAASLLDSGSNVRTFLMSRFINEGPELIDLLRDEKALTDYVCGAVVSLWHPSCTCRMGEAGDPDAVLDSHGRVLGLDGILVGDASAMPNVPTTNTNIPTLMMAERISEELLAKTPTSSGSGRWAALAT